METNVQKLERILQEIHEHAGATTLWSDLQWMLKVQADSEAWAKPIFEKWNEKFGRTMQGT